MNALSFFRRHRTIMLLGAALGFGALATLAARGYIGEYLERERERLQPTQTMTEVVVAKRDLDVGETVSADSMAARRVPAEYVSGTAVRPGQFEGFVGARLSAPMRSGEVLLQGTIVGADVATFSAKIRPGIRALTIAVDEINSVSGMLQPGDRIDLLLTARPPGSNAAQLLPEATAPLMQGLLVLATGRQVRPGGEDSRLGRGFTTITVEVTPEQAQRLIVAQRGGKLTATLRHPDDRAALARTPLDLYGLLGVAPAKATAPMRAGPEIIVGGRGSMSITGSVTGADETVLAASAPTLNGHASVTTASQTPPAPTLQPTQSR